MYSPVFIVKGVLNVQTRSPFSNIHRNIYIKYANDIIDIKELLFLYNSDI